MVNWRLQLVNVNLPFANWLKIYKNGFDYDWIFSYCIKVTKEGLHYSNKSLVLQKHDIFDIPYPKDVGGAIHQMT